MQEYRTTMASHSFWLMEFEQYIQLFNQGLSAEEIRIEVVEHNYFKQNSIPRRRELFNVVRRRFSQLDRSYLQLFSEVDLSNQKLINLIAIMKSDRLFNEFMYEVYREELVLGDQKLHGYEVEAFFNRKQAESSKVAGWTDQTVRRLMGTFKTILRESGLTKMSEDYDQVQRPMLDLRLEDLMRSNGDICVLATLIGR